MDFDNESVREKDMKEYLNETVEFLKDKRNKGDRCCDMNLELTLYEMEAVSKLLQLIRKK